MLQFLLVSTDHRQLDDTVGRVVQALPEEERAQAEVNLLAKQGSRLRRQITVPGDSDKLVRKIALLSLPGDVEIGVRVTDEPKA